MEKKIAFAIFGSTVRSGSTLLQRIAGSNPCSICWGENGRVLNKVITMKHDLIRYSTFDSDGTASYLNEKNPNIWIANMSPTDPNIIKDALLNSSKILFESLYFPATPESFYNIGFKDVGIIIEGVELFKDIFPLSKVVLVARNPVDVWRSAHQWKYDLDVFINDWKTITVDYFNSSLPFIWYDDLVMGHANHFLAKTFDISIAEVEHILAIKVGDTPKELKDMTKQIELDFIKDSYNDLLKDLGLKDRFVSILPY